MDYLIIKWLHIVSAALLYGACAVSALSCLAGRRQASLLPALLACNIQTDRCVIFPSMVLHPVSGVMMMMLADFPAGSLWMSSSIALYVFSLVILVYIHMLHRETRAQLVRPADAPADSAIQDNLIRLLGCMVLVITALTIAYWLMVAKPV